MVSFIHRSDDVDVDGDGGGGNGNGSMLIMITECDWGYLWPFFRK